MPPAIAATAPLLAPLEAVCAVGGVCGGGGVAASAAATDVSAVAEDSVVPEVSGVLSFEFFPMTHRITAEGERKV